MFLREVKRQNKNGTQASYLQLVHNQWDPTAQASRTRILYSFGRTDQVERAAIERLIASLSRLLDPATAFRVTASSELTFLEARPLGGAHLLDGMWQRLGIDQVMRKLLKGRRLDPRVERVLFALVANRALDASSKLAAAGWITHDVHIEGLPETSEDACYRAMDWLLEIAGDLERAVFWQLASLLDLEVDLLFFDTTSTYFERDEPDAPLARDERGRPLPDQDCDPDPDPDPGDGDGDGDGDGERLAGFRTYGKSKDHRGDLPQVVIGMAVTRGGIPVRVWCWPGNTTDSALIRQVKDDLKAWKLTRVVWVADRGFTSDANRRFLQRAGGHYILGEKLRCDQPEVTAALSRQGRYHQVAGNLHVKEVSISDHERFVICSNPDQADRDATVRGKLLAQLEEAIAGSDRLSATKRAELVGQVSTRPGLKRYLRRTPRGLLRVDRSAVAAEARLDGKYLLRSSDPGLSAEDIAVGYKQLLQVERGWRSMKTTLDLRPVYHRLEERIRAHVLLCWLALLLVRTVETTCDATWGKLREELELLHVGVFTGPAGSFRQRTELTKTQRDILAKLAVGPPGKLIELATPPAR